MKILRVGEPGQERPAVMDVAGGLRDVTTAVADWTAATIGAIPDLHPADYPVIDGNPRIGIPIANPGKVICIGQNYAAHARETGGNPPEQPIVFMKANSALNGPNDVIRMPRGSTDTDWEVELAVIIGKHAQYVSEDAALDYVAGYATFNDVSERRFQQRMGGQWTKGKSCDTFGPFGPMVVTADEVGDPQNLRLQSWVNGAPRQDSNTGDMIFPVAHLISYLSQMMSLHPGDVIATGTPEGVGLGMNPPQFLKAGDVVEIEVQGLGRQRSLIEAD